MQVRLVPERVLYSEERIQTPDDLYRLVAEEMKSLDREMVCAIHLTSKNHPISMTFCSMGSINQSIISPREIFKSAILSNAAAIIIAHNHPSSDCTPSRDDVQVTRRMVACGELMDIPVLDHIIISGYTGNYFSFQENKMMSNEELVSFMESLGGEQMMGKVAGVGEDNSRNYEASEQNRNTVHSVQKRKTKSI